MHIYRTGLIGEVIHSRIDSAKNGETPTESFGDTLRAMMYDTNAKPKTVSAVRNAVTEPTTISGSDLIYAMRNSGTDTTAASVLNLLGYGSVSSGNSLKTAADALSAEVRKLTAILPSADEDAIKAALPDLTSKYNAIQTLLNTTYTGSGAVYSNLFRMTAQTASEKLAAAGITADEKGLLTFKPENFTEADLSSFLSGAASAASTLSSYASAIKSQSLSSLLGSDDDSDDSDGSMLSSYYNALAGFYS